MFICRFGLFVYLLHLIIIIIIIIRLLVLLRAEAVILIEQSNFVQVH